MLCCEEFEVSRFGGKVCCDYFVIFVIVIYFYFMLYCVFYMFLLEELLYVIIFGKGCLREGVIFFYVYNVGWLLGIVFSI